MSERRDVIFNPGDLLNNTYRIEAILGRGGTSEVYRARSEITGRLVALKVLRSEFANNEDYLALMRREEEIRDVRHDAVVRYFDNQKMADGTVYLVMDHIDGPGLHEKLRAGGMSPYELIAVMERIAKGLAEAHRHNIIHRDLSPDNIILRNGRAEQAVIIDFGIAKDIKQGSVTIVGNEFAGKYGYAAPEQLAGLADARSDLYSLGALILATFRGRPPDVGSNLLEVVQNKGRPLDTGSVPDPLRGLIDRLTAPRPEDRFQTAEALLEAIAQALEVSGEETIIPPRRREAAATETPRAPAGAKVQTETVFDPGSVPSRGRAADPRPAGTAAATQRPRPEPNLAPRRSPVTPLVLAAAMLGLIAMGYFAFPGLIPGSGTPPLPWADPFRLVAEQAEGQPPVVTGNVPDDEVEAAVRRFAEMRGGRAELTLATGDIGANWGAGVLSLLDVASKLPEWRVEVANDHASVSGIGKDRAQTDVLVAALASAGSGLAVTQAVAVGPRRLERHVVDEAIAPHADCGPLQAKPPDGSAWRLGETVSVTGTVASETTGPALAKALAPVVGDRPVSLRLTDRRPVDCAVDRLLAERPSGGFRIVFGHGDRADPNPDGRYVVGDNPTIDLLIPDGVTGGYLHVDAFDSNGGVVHLLPNPFLADNSVEGLRGGRAGPVETRLAFSVAQGEESPQTRPYFTISRVGLGETRLVVIHTDRPVVAARPDTQEATEGYAAAFAELTAEAQSVDSAMMTTAMSP